MYLSIDGVLPIDYLQSLEPERVKLALNRDPIGQNLARQAQVELPQIEQIPPSQIDWLNTLQVERQKIISQQLQPKSPQRER
ncbi:hypothetical protein IQ266_12075 [filamentous cyanobacterium LEGE 11480]|uniref:Uncharacterized protein n=1 Tax=Romeriopsis navalis LEGE 11480 TaxID=2777977 RepID=A0A928Z4L2_9CYAN|nr:hypothetical protein [Romeriopsis navalis]MBE9030468.1 hypothetical protein [Romeriopsis navalis LEGE 11480]